MSMFLSVFFFICCRNLNAIFRNSSFSAFTIEESLRLVGRSYLFKVLSTEVEKIKEENKHCEVDPARLSLSNGILPSRSVDSPSSNNDCLGSNKVRGGYTLSTCPISVGFRPAVLGCSFCIIINFLTSQSLNYDIKKLIMMQKLEPRTAGLKPNKIGYVDWVIAEETSLLMF